MQLLQPSHRCADAHSPLARLDAQQHSKLICAVSWALSFLCAPFPAHVLAVPFSLVPQSNPQAQQASRTGQEQQQQMSGPPFAPPPGGGQPYSSFPRMGGMPFIPGGESRCSLLRCPVILHTNTTDNTHYLCSLRRWATKHDGRPRQRCSTRWLTHMAVLITPQAAAMPRGLQHTTDSSRPARRCCCPSTACCRPASRHARHAPHPWRHTPSRRLPRGRPARRLPSRRRPAAPAARITHRPQTLFNSLCGQDCCQRV
jgi:hypothetical protein